jgi:IS4 transposase
VVNFLHDLNWFFSGDDAMVLNDIFQRFVQESPVSVMVRIAMENIFAASKVDAIFEAHAQRQRTNELLFSTVADLLGAVTCRIRPSVNAAYQAKVKEMGVSIHAVYDKLSGVEPNVARALVRETSLKMTAIIEKTGGTRPVPLPKYRLKIVDGNHLRRTERRLGELRDENVAPLPGQALVVFDPRLRLVIDVIPCEDGHAQERRLLPELLKRVDPKDLWIADRNFCTTGFLWGILEQRGYFVIRQHAKTLYWELLGKRKKVGRIATGMVYEQTLLLGDGQGRTRKIRRITIELDQPTRNNDQELHLLTNLPASVSALQIAELYSDRWQIETAFQELAENLCGEIATLAYPKAALFAFSLALVAYNILSVVKAALQAAHGLEQAEDVISSYYLADEVAQTYRGQEIALGSDYWQRFTDMTALQLARELLKIAAQVDLARYQKHVRGPKKKKPPMNKKKRKTVATARLLDISS